MSDEIASAQILFKDVVINEGIQIDDECWEKLFANAVFCYVPHMVQMHREVWTEEQLLVFYVAHDVSSEVGRRKNRRGKIIFEPIEALHQIPQMFEQIVNIVGHEYPLPKEVIPEYYFIDPKHFKRVLDLLVFS